MAERDKNPLAKRRRLNEVIDQLLEVIPACGGITKIVREALENEDVKISMDSMYLASSVVIALAVRGIDKPTIHDVSTKIVAKMEELKSTGPVGVDVHWNIPSVDFCGSKGSTWLYQSDPELEDKVQKGLDDHYKSTLRNSVDKSDHPLFLVMSGPGTGKSRLLDEFHNLAISSCKDDALKNKLKNAYVFKVNFDNGTQIDFQDSAARTEIGSRMYHQLHPKSLSWDDFKADPNSKVTPRSVLGKLASVTEQNLKDLTIIVLVDGLQRYLHHTPSGSKDTCLYGAIGTLSELVNSSGNPNDPFVICCAAATIKQSLIKCIAPSRQRRIALTPPKLDGSEIIETDDPLEKMLIDDMGGHGRALEVLAMVLEQHGGTEYKIGDVLKEICSSLAELYVVWPLEKVEEVLFAVFTRKKFYTREEYLGSYTVEDIEQLGFITWNKSTLRLDCPFIWLKFAAGDLLTKMYTDPSYGQLLNPEKYPCDVGSWESWEDFVVRFWCMKTRVFNGKEMNWFDLHAGATFKGIEGPKVFVKALTRVNAAETFPTKSVAVTTTLSTEFGTVNPLDCSEHILSDHGNSGGDSFCCIEESLPDNARRTITFAVSNKYSQDKHVVKGSRSLKEYTKEYEKAASTHDLFMEYSTGTYSFFDRNLPNGRCGFVDSNNARDYFGPFAGRAFWGISGKAINVNTAKRSHLESVVGVGEVLADKIMTERDLKLFENASELSTRIPKLRKTSSFSFN